jgi:hypothetical protein
MWIPNLETLGDKLLTSWPNCYAALPRGKEPTVDTE